MLPLTFRGGVISNSPCWSRISAIPSLRAKKYDEARNIWQARVSRDWRLYFVIEEDVYYLLDVMPHPK